MATTPTPKKSKKSNMIYFAIFGSGYGTLLVA